jgi:hypothetical protein
MQQMASRASSLSRQMVMMLQQVLQQGIAGLQMK